jgi:beta-N-acetylhexosaminidase
LAVIVDGDDDGPTEVATGRGPSTTSAVISAPSSAPTTSTTVTGTVPPTPPATEPRCSSAERPLRDRAALLVFASVADAESLDAALELGTGGVFIPSGATELITEEVVPDAVAASGAQPLVAIDEEGGIVQRIPELFGEVPAARELARKSPEEIQAIARTYGEKMADAGITLDFAPVVDVVEDEDLDRGAIRSRSFSDDPEEVAVAAGAFAAGLTEAGVTPTFKHFPGHGHASGDSHDERVTTPDLEALRAEDLIPFVELMARFPDAAVMVGHLEVPGLTGGEPATTSSEAITGLLRGELGFDGLVVSDDLGMGAITARYEPVEAAVRAVIAGSDLALVAEVDAEPVVDALERAVADGRLPEAQLTASADRVLAAQSSSC